jgi:hypothetical protein
MIVGKILPHECDQYLLYNHDHCRPIFQPLSSDFYCCRTSLSGRQRFLEFRGIPQLR